MINITPERYYLYMTEYIDYDDLIIDIDIRYAQAGMLIQAVFSQVILN